jgi:hypothetical protein
MTAGWEGLVAAIIAGSPRLRDAACRGRAGLFDSLEDADTAIAICGSCPELAPCRRWANALAHDEIDGVVGGELRAWVSHPSRSRTGGISGEP